MKKKIRVKMMVTKRWVNGWFKNIDIFFILGMGRSGTKFLSNLLNKDLNVLVAHQPEDRDYEAYKEAFYSQKKANKYFKNYRKKEIYLRIKDKKIKAYGEVNSVIRRHCNAIKNNFLNVKLIHIIRDGRDVVRSIMSRKTMTEKDPHTTNIRPKKKDPWYDKWSNMNRFERVCWYWNVENRYLKEYIKDTIHFEKLLLSYDYFEEKILKPLNMNIPEYIWDKEVNSPINITQKFKIPHWTEWDDKELASFNQICGLTMREFGYDMK